MIYRIGLILILPMAAIVVAPAALAVIKVTNTVAKMYNEGSSIVVGKVTKVNENGIIEAAVTTLKGDGVGGTLKIVKIENLPDVSKAVKEGSPLVLIIARRASASALHLADHWLLPEFLPTAKPNLVVRKELNLAQSFPGTTTGLAAAMQSLKEGNYSMLDAASPEMFKGPARDLQKFDVPNLRALFVFRLPGKKQQGVLAISPQGARSFFIDTGGFRPSQEPNEATLRFPFDPTQLIAITLGHDRRYLGLKRDGEVEEFQSNATSGGAKHKLWSDSSTASAAAIGDFGEEPDRLYAIVVKDDNIYRYPLDGKGEPADFVRLTGERVSTYHKENPRWLAGATACALDCNGDGRMDVLINTPAGPMLLINRGYGAFFINADLGKILKTSGGEPLVTEKTLWTAADVDGDRLDDLIIVSPVTGTVTAVMNPKPEKKE